jgi:hypothetical protein
MVLDGERVADNDGTEDRDAVSDALMERLAVVDRLGDSVFVRDADADFVTLFGGAAVGVVHGCVLHTTMSKVMSCWQSSSLMNGGASDDSHTRRSRD